MKKIYLWVSVLFILLLASWVLSQQPMAKDYESKWYQSGSLKSCVGFGHVDRERLVKNVEYISGHLSKEETKAEILKDPSFKYHFQISASWKHDGSVESVAFWNVQDFEMSPTTIYGVPDDYDYSDGKVERGVKFVDKREMYIKDVEAFENALAEFKAGRESRLGLKNVLQITRVSILIITLVSMFLVVSQLKRKKMVTKNG